MADSVLVILVGQEELKVLYTEKFNRGSIFEQKNFNIIQGGDMLLNR